MESGGFYLIVKVLIVLCFNIIIYIFFFSFGHFFSNKHCTLKKLTRILAHNIICIIFNIYTGIDICRYLGTVLVLLAIRYSVISVVSYPS